MTVNPTVPLTGPTVADGVNRNWPFSFKITDVSQMRLRIVDADGVSNPVEVSSGFTIAGNYINNDLGGIVVYPISPTTPVDATRKVFAYRAVPYDQPVKIGNQGGFYPGTHEGAFDNLAMQVQQLAEVSGRSVTVPIGSATDPDTVIAELEAAVDAAEDAAAAAAVDAAAADAARIAAEAAAASINGPMIFQGAWDASAGTFPGTVGRKKGWAYIVTVAGTVGGQAFEVNDQLVALVDNASTTVYAANWYRLEADLVQSVAGLVGAISAVNLRDALDVPPYVTSRAALKALDTTKDVVAYLAEINRWGKFIWRTGNYAALVAIDTQEGYVIKADAIAATAGAWVRDTSYITPNMFGAVGDGATADDAAVNCWFAVLMATLLDGRLEGKYNLTAFKNWDFSPRRVTGVKITGRGPNTDYFQVVDTTTSPAMYWHSNSQALFFCTFRDFGIRTFRAGVGTQIGQNDLVDAWNQCVFDNIVVTNGSQNAANVALRLNHVLGSYFNMTVNAAGSGSPGSPGAPGWGTAVQFRQVVGGKGAIHGGNAAVTHHYLDGFNYGNSWDSTNIEETGTAIKVDNAQTLRNSYKGGYFVASTLIAAVAGNNNIFENGNISLYGGGTLGTLTGWDIINQDASSLRRRITAAGMSLSHDNSPIDPGKTLHLYRSSAGTVGLRLNVGPAVFDIDNNNGHIALTNYNNGATVNWNQVGAAGVYNWAVDSVNKMTLDNNGLAIAGRIRSTDPLKGVGYDTGAGGSVLQATNKSTGVTLNKVTGQITMNGAALAAGATATFTLTNSAIAATDTVIANIGSGATSAAYTLTVDAVSAGSCRMSLVNRSAGSLSEAIVINFAVLKGVIN